MLKDLNFQLDAILDLIPDHTRIAVIENKSVKDKNVLYRGYRKGIVKFFSSQTYKYNVINMTITFLGEYPSLTLLVVENIKENEKK